MIIITVVGTKWSTPLLEVCLSVCTLPNTDRHLLLSTHTHQLKLPTGIEISAVDSRTAQVGDADADVDALTLHFWK